MSWREEQQWFWQQIRRRKAPDDDEKSLSLHVSAHTRISRRAALGIYHNAYHQRLLHFASELYPVLYRTLETELFEALWLDYFEQHPPEPGPVGSIGRALPQWLAAHPEYGRLPALHDIAELENRFIDHFEAPDIITMTREQLQALPPDQWPALHWRAPQHWSLMRSDFDLPTYWQRLREFFDRDPGPAPGSAPFGVERQEAPHWFLVHRQQQTMQLQRLTSAMTLFLQGIREGADFATLCERLAEQYPDRNIPELSLALLLQAIRWELLPAPD